MKTFSDNSKELPSEEYGKREPGIKNGETARLMNRIKRDIIIPQLRKRPMGDIYYVDISSIEGDAQHEKRADILKMFDKGLSHLIRNYRRSKYYEKESNKKNRSKIVVLKKILKYYHLFRSVKKNGFCVDEKRIDSFPWLFASKSITSRLDGHHRVSAARFLGYKEIPVLLITPKDLLRLDGLPAETIEFLRSLDEPDIRLLKPYGK